MKLTLLISATVILAMQLTFAQTTAKGSVTDEKGNALHFAFVEDLQIRNAVFTDSTGNFIIAVNPSSRLLFRYKGYKDTVVNKFDQDVKVILRSGGPGGASPSEPGLSTVNTIISQPVAPSLHYADMSATANGTGLLPSVAHQKGNVHGNRYMFDTFVHGYVSTPDGALIENPDYLFDYDKIGGAFLLTENNKGVTQVNDSQVKTFTLYANDDQRCVFEKIPAVDNVHYVQVLSSGKKYTIVKQIKTTFIKSNYVNSGLTSHGNDYDEFVDVAQYYLLDAAGGEKHRLSLKKKSLKEVFSKEADKLNKYLSAHNSDEIDDKFLTGLGEAMNN